MFRSRKNQPLEKPEVKVQQVLQKENLKKISMVEVAETVIKPLIFLDPSKDAGEKISQVIEFPFIASARINSDIGKMLQREEFSEVGEKTLEHLSYNNIRIGSDNVVNYIIQLSIANVAHAIIFDSYAVYFERLAAVKYITEALNSEDCRDRLNSILYPLFQKGHDNFIGTSNFNNISGTMASSKLMCDLVTQVIVSQICLGFDKCLNDAYNAPDIVFNQEVKLDNYSDDFKINVITTLKGEAGRIVEYLTFATGIIPAFINDTIGSYVLSLSCVFDDYLYYDKNAQLDQIKNLEKQGDWKKTKF